MSREHTLGQKANGPLDPDIIRRLEGAHAFIVKNFAKGPDLSTIARVANLSPFHFHRVFRKHFGYTPKALTSKRQIDAAQRLMLEGASLAKVAYHVGYNNQSEFTGRFKQAMGMPPGKWLRKQKSERE